MKQGILITDSPIAYWDLNLVQKSAVVSGGFLKMISYEEPEFSFELLLQLIFRIESEFVLNCDDEKIERVSTENKVIDLKYRCKSGVFIWAVCSLHVIEREGDKPKRIIGNNIDITKQRIEHLESNRRNQLFDQFINSTPDLFFLKDDKFEYLIVNDALSKMYGKPKDQIISKTDFDLLPEELAIICRESDTKPLESSELIVREERDVLGQVIQTYKFPVILENGKIGVGTYGRDITEKVLAEKEVTRKQNEIEFYKNSITNSTLYLEMDFDFNITQINDRFCDLLGIKNDDLQKRNIRDIVHPNEFLDVLSEKSKWEGEISFTTDQDQVFVYALFFPLVSDELYLERIILIGYDMSSQLALSAQLSLELENSKSIAKSFLEYQEKERAEVINEIHDGISQLLFASRLHFENVTLCDDLEFERGLLHLKEALQEIKNITINESVYWPEEMSLGNVITNYVSKLNELGRVNFTCLVDQNCEKLQFSRELKLNYFRIIQIATQNTLKHSFGSNCSILVYLKNGKLFTEVTDDGIGFSQTTENGGMGLQNIKNRVKILKGDLSVSSEKGVGTKISFNIDLFQIS